MRERKKSIKKILIFNPFGIGDVLFTTPLLRNLKDYYKNAFLCYICNRRTYPLLKNNIYVDKVLIFEKDEWRFLAKVSKMKFLNHFISFFQEVRKEQFDVLFDLSLNSQYGFFMKMTGIPVRVGFDFRKRGRFLTHAINVPRGYSEKHVARYYLELLTFLNLDNAIREYPFDLFLSDEQKENAKKYFQEAGLNPQAFIIVVCPGSGDSWGDAAYFKRWPTTNFLNLCALLQKELRAKVVLCGSKIEIPLSEYIYTHLEEKPLDLCGKIGLEDFIGVISSSDLVITNDGGPFHIAQALRKKTIVFFGPVDDIVYGPFPNDENISLFKTELTCRSCYEAFKFKGCIFDKKCLREIKVEDVFATIKNIAQE